jgi:hypothetical protein
MIEPTEQSLKERNAKERYKWMEAVLAAPEFTAAQKAVLMRLALHQNVKTRRCDPSIVGLAAGSAVGDRAVQKTLVVAENRGWIKRHVGGGRSNRSTYDLRFPKTDAAEKTPSGGSPFAEPEMAERVNGGAQKGERRFAKPRPVVHPNTKEQRREHSLSRRETNGRGDEREKAASEVQQWEAPPITFGEVWERTGRQGKRGVALAAWNKLARSRQAEIAAAIHRHGGRIDLGDTWLSVWIEGECWREPTASADHHHAAPGSAEWLAERERLLASGQSVKFMDDLAEQGKGWTVRKTA